MEPKHVTTTQEAGSSAAWRKLEELAPKPPDERQSKQAVELFNSAKAKNGESPLSALLEMLDTLLDAGDVTVADQLLSLTFMYLSHLAYSNNPPIEMLIALEEHLAQQERANQFYMETSVILTTGRSPREFLDLKTGKIDVGDVSATYEFEHNNDMTSMASPLIEKIRDAYELRRTEVVRTQRGS